MKKVFLVSAIIAGEAEPPGIFSSKEKAEEFISSHSQGRDAVYESHSGSISLADHDIMEFTLDSASGEPDWISPTYRNENLSLLPRLR
jgi:hypothetical protein